MATFKSALLTSKGIALLAKASTGKATIEFTRAATGDGSYVDSENTTQRNELKSPKQSFPITNIKIINNSTVYLKFVISNIELTHGYYIKEVGIYAKDPDEGEILYSLAVAVENEYDFLPAYNELIPSTIIMEFYTEVSNAKEVRIEVQEGVFALAEDLIQLEKTMQIEIDKLKQIKKIEEDEIDLILDGLAEKEDESDISSGEQVPDGDYELITEEDILNVLRN